MILSFQNNIVVNYARFIKMYIDYKEVMTIEKILSLWLNLLKQTNQFCFVDLRNLCFVLSYRFYRN